MAKSGERLLMFVFSSLIFCISVSLLLYQLNSVNSALNTFYYNDENIMSEKVYEPEEEVTYADVISNLMTTLEYDVEVNGMYISKHNHRAIDLNYYDILPGLYTKSYDYDVNGNITRVIYRSSK